MIVAEFFDVDKSRSIPWQRRPQAIAEGLTRDDISSPSAYDPKRNSHRCGIARSYGAVRAILANPRHTGRQVWNKQPKSEQLIDVNDVALRHTTKQTWNEPGEWIWSKEIVHEPSATPRRSTCARNCYSRTSTPGYPAS